MEQPAAQSFPHLRKEDSLGFEGSENQKAHKRQGSRVSGFIARPAHSLLPGTEERLKFFLEMTKDSRGGSWQG